MANDDPIARAAVAVVAANHWPPAAPRGLLAGPEWDFPQRPRDDWTAAEWRRYAEHLEQAGHALARELVEAGVRLQQALNADPTGYTLQSFKRGPGRPPKPKPSKWGLLTVQTPVGRPLELTSEQKRDLVADFDAFKGTGTDMGAARAIAERQLPAGARASRVMERANVIVQRVRRLRHEIRKVDQNKAKGAE
jgi:hypothetical protein